ncbi:uncharacterized protein GGS25DRAFT_480131 [Hypoxylon fragiforme]|uniref:uncharacterized protein n=1 Tax=Hypoxylon fragiforme TaxID=63214 RepID=UPI0020C6408C|nr:uncharacterized protein GGS25DRAFT_480131 [Hypoxylon fragiforme]KAI2610822.1 hypothetical protein GGS25DRAFT_480131 [Hypoxylon fragiforme]
MAVAVVLVLVLVVLRRWRSGVATNPWSICGAAALALNPELRRLLIGAGAGGGSGIGDEAAGVPKGMLESVLAERRFKLGYFYGPNGTVEYGIMLHGKLPRGNRESFLSDQYDDLKDPLNQPARTEPKQHLPFLMLGIAGRVVFLFLLCGLLALILTYANTGGKTAFEDFMDSESFGVRFLFTSVGVIISFFWAGFFGSIATLSPYQLLAKSPQKAHRSILLAPPTNAFSGLWSAIRRRDLFLAIVAFTSILSEFLTVALSNIPFRVTQTFLAHTVCMWLAVSILCVMVLVVLASFFLLAAWPHMPVDPGTIAGAMYYVCDSWMLVRMEGLSTLKRRDRDWRVNQMGLRYEFGEIRGADSGVVRVGVDASTASMAAAKGTSWAL